LLATPVRTATEPDLRDLKAKVGELLNRRPAVGFAAGVIRDGHLEFFHAHGLADIASNTPVTEDTVFRVASITKTFTAIALMQLWEQGLVDLDAPANDYLRAFKLVPAKPGFRPATLRHLLTHTAGLSEMVHPSHAVRYIFGESVKRGERTPSLGEYYRGGLRLAAEPGTRFRYTDHSFSTVGQIVEDVSGLPLHVYMRERIFDPLGMADTDLGRSDRVTPRLATGYTLGAGGPKPVTDRDWITFAASMAYSTPRDMARYVAALVGGGANEHGSVLKPATLAQMYAPQYQPHPLVSGMGLAFSRYDFGGHLCVEHGGILPGFNSQIFAAPDDGIGVIAFTNGARQAMLWLPAEGAGLLKQLLHVPGDRVRTDLPQQPRVWGDICGRYNLGAGVADTRLLALAGMGAEVFVRRGELRLRVLSPVPALYRGFALHPDDDRDPYVFRIDASEFGVGTSRIIFGRDAGTGRIKLYLDVFPLALEKAPAASHRPWAAAAAGAVALGTALAVARRRGRQK
jgi:CubicO group peptidase (beta-lactamase class C family)